MTNTVVGIIKIIVLGKSNNPKLCFTIYVAKEIWLSERLLNLDSSHQLEQKCQQGDNFFSAIKKKTKQCKFTLLYLYSPQRGLLTFQL